MDVPLSLETAYKSRQTEKKEVAPLLLHEPATGGSDPKKDEKQQVYYKLLSLNLKQKNQFQWKLGWNEDRSGGGLHILTVDQIPLWITKDWPVLGLVEVHPFYSVVQEPCGYVADRVLLRSTVPLKEWEGWDNEEYRIRVCRQTGAAIQFVPVKYQTPELRRIALSQDGRALRYLENWTHEEVLVAVEQNYLVAKDCRLWLTYPTAFRRAIFLSQGWIVEDLKKKGVQLDKEYIDLADTFIQTEQKRLDALPDKCKFCNQVLNVYSEHKTCAKCIARIIPELLSCPVQDQFEAFPVSILDSVYVITPKNIRKTRNGGFRLVLPLDRNPFDTNQK